MKNVLIILLLLGCVWSAYRIHTLESNLESLSLIQKTESQAKLTEIKSLPPDQSLDGINKRLSEAKFLLQNLIEEKTKLENLLKKETASGDPEQLKLKIKEKKELFQELKLQYKTQSGFNANKDNSGEAQKAWSQENAKQLLQLKKDITTAEKEIHADRYALLMKKDKAKTKGQNPPDLKVIEDKFNAKKKELAALVEKRNNLKEAIGVTSNKLKKQDPATWKKLQDWKKELRTKMDALNNELNQLQSALKRDPKMQIEIKQKIEEMNLKIKEQQLLIADLEKGLK